MSLGEVAPHVRVADIVAGTVQIQHNTGVERERDNGALLLPACLCGSSGNASHTINVVAGVNVIAGMILVARINVVATSAKGELQCQQFCWSKMNLRF